MALTYDPIATTTLGSATSNITFSSIPSTYTDLILVINGGLSSTGAMTVQVNSDTGTNYSYTRFYGNGTTATSDRFSSQAQFDIGYVSTALENSVFVHFMNYSNTTTYKTILGRWGSTTYTTAEVGLWRSTSAINAIKIFNTGAFNLITGTTATLYGVKAA